MYVLALETSGRIGSIALLETIAGGAAIVVEATHCPQANVLPDRSCRASNVCSTTNRGKPPISNSSRRPPDPGRSPGFASASSPPRRSPTPWGRSSLGFIHLRRWQRTSTLPRRPVWTILDAQREELFAARFELGVDLADDRASATEILGIAAWLARLQPGDAVAGPPLAKLRERLPAGIDVVDDVQWQPSAAATGRLAIELARRGVTTPPLELVPHYYRKSVQKRRRRHLQNRELGQLRGPAVPIGRSGGSQPPR